MSKTHYTDEEVLKNIEDTKKQLLEDMDSWRERLNEPNKGRSWNVIHNLYMDSEGYNLLMNIPDWVVEEFKSGKFDMMLLIDEVSTARVAHLAYDSYDEAWEEVLQNI